MPTPGTYTHTLGGGLTSAPQWGQPASPLEVQEKKVPEKKKKKGNKIYNVPLLEAFPHKLMSKKTEGEIGLEIECEGMNLFDKPISYWSTHPDNSLRPYKDHPPLEYVLRKPLSRADTTKALTYLTRKLKEAGSTLIESTRTSVHVHLNCQQLTLKQVYQFWCLYSVFEEMLIEFSGPDRVGNLFCLGGKHAEQNVIVMEQAIQTENFGELFDNNLRYTSCNMASIGKFGSMEFRCMRGTVDQHLIQTWVDLLCIIKDKALEYKNPQEIVEHFLKVGPEDFLRQTFQSRYDILQIFLEKQNRHTVMWDGMRMMRDVAYAITWEEFDPSLVPEKGSKAELGKITDTWYEVSSGVWLRREAHGRWYLMNYNYQTVVDVPVFASVITIGERDVYRVSGTGMYESHVRGMSPDETAPDQEDYV